MGKISYIFGASGFAKEVEWLVSEVNKTLKEPYIVKAFVVSDNDLQENNGLHGIKIISESDFLEITQSSEDDLHCFLGIANSVIREKIVTKLQHFSRIIYPNLVASDVVYDDRPGYIELGIGNIICSGSKITTDIRLGNFIHINLNCTIGHDSIIENFVTLAPGVHISGNVKLNQHDYIGTGAVVLQQKSICERVIIGAGAVVVKDITEYGIYAGIPAKKIK